MQACTVGQAQKKKTDGETTKEKDDTWLNVEAASNAASSTINWNMQA